MHAISVSRVSKRALDFMKYNYDALLLRRFHCQNNRGHRCDTFQKLLKRFYGNRALLDTMACMTYKGGLLSHELSDFQAELEPPIHIIKQSHQLQEAVRKIRPKSQTVEKILVINHRWGRLFCENPAFRNFTVKLARSIAKAMLRAYCFSLQIFNPA